MVGRVPISPIKRVSSVPNIITSTTGNYEDRHRVLVAHCDYLHTKKRPLHLLWQETAENFYPERADFTYNRRLGVEFADYLSTSVPPLIRRSLADQVNAMLRPAGQNYAHIATNRPDDALDNDSLKWLEEKTEVMFRAITDRDSRFTRATKEADNDFVTFGQAVLSVEINYRTNSLLYRTWHLRDVAWCERMDGSIATVCRKWKPHAKDLVSLFKGKVHPMVQRAVDANNGADAYKEINVYHIIVPSEDFDYSGKTKYDTPYVSLYIDTDHKFIMEERGVNTPYYIIPRWQTVSGSQYAYSPCTVVGLPDGRLLQAITFTLLKAGEKATDPPMIATEDMVRSPIDIRAGGVTWVDADYDERLGDVLRPMTIDSRGIPIGFNSQDRLTETLKSAFYLDKLNLPQYGPEMTAYEVSQRLQEYIRQALPLFQPIEEEYNAPLFEQTFALLMKVGAFGSPYDIPPALQGSDIRFKFESPLIDAGDAKLVQTFNVAAQMIQEAAVLDPSAQKMLNVQVALREALHGGGAPADWLESEQDMAQIKADMDKEQAQLKQVQMMQAAGEAGQSVGAAGQNIAGAVQQATGALGGQ